MRDITDIAPSHSLKTFWLKSTGGRQFATKTLYVSSDFRMADSRMAPLADYCHALRVKEVGAERMVDIVNLAIMMKGGPSGDTEGNTYNMDR